MLLSVHAADVSLDWGFAGSGRLDSWLATQPWVGEGGILSARVSGTRAAEAFTTSLATWIKAVDAGASDVSLRSLRLDAASSQSVAELLMDALALETESERTLAGLAAYLDAGPQLFVLDATNAEARAGDVASTLEELREDLRKRRARAALSAIVLHRTHWRQGAVENYELDIGGPVQVLLDTGHATQHNRWCTYLHTRLAWEAGGHLDRMLAWCEESPLAIPMGQDGKVEALLNGFAWKHWSEVDPVDRGRILTAIRCGKGGERAEQVATLIRDRYFWQPFGSALARPVPWVARQLLALGEGANAYELLRSSLVCGPLLRNAMGRCLELEAHVRASLRESLCKTPPIEATNRFDDYRNGRAIECSLYPPDCPALPTGDWSFAEFGAFIGALDVTKETRDTLHRLRLLRNSLAHGHYVSWKVFETLSRLETGLLDLGAREPTIVLSRRR